MKYNWEKIIKLKSDEEIISFLENHYYTEVESRFYALKELKSRKYDQEVILRHQNSLTNECSVQLNNLSKQSLRELLIAINPYIILMLSLYFLINLLIKDINWSFNNIWFAGAIFFGVGGILDLIASKIRIKKINKRKQIKRNQLEIIISELNN